MSICAISICVSICVMSITVSEPHRRTKTYIRPLAVHQAPRLACHATAWCQSARCQCVCVCRMCVCVAGRRAWWEGRIERIQQQKQEPHTLMWGIMLWGCRAPETCLPTKYMAGVVLRSVARKRCVSALESDFKLCQGCVPGRVSRRIATSTVAAQAM